MLLFYLKQWVVEKRHFLENPYSTCFLCDDSDSIIFVILGESDYSAKCSGSHSTSSSVSGKGVLHDDSGHFSVPLEVKRGNDFIESIFCKVTETYLIWFTIEFALILGEGGILRSIFTQRLKTFSVTPCFLFELYCNLNNLLWSG